MILKELLCLTFFLLYIHLLFNFNIVNSQSDNHLYNISNENHYINNKNIDPNDCKSIYIHIGSDDALFDSNLKVLYYILNDNNNKRKKEITNYNYDNIYKTIDNHNRFNRNDRDKNKKVDIDTRLFRFLSEYFNNHKINSNDDVTNNNDIINNNISCVIDIIRIKIQNNDNYNNNNISKSNQQIRFNFENMLLSIQEKFKNIQISYNVFFTQQDNIDNNNDNSNQYHHDDHNSSTSTNKIKDISNFIITKIINHQYYHTTESTIKSSSQSPLSSSLSSTIASTDRNTITNRVPPSIIMTIDNDDDAIIILPHLIKSKILSYIDMVMLNDNNKNRRDSISNSSYNSSIESDIHDKNNHTRIMIDSSLRNIFDHNHYIKDHDDGNGDGDDRVNNVNYNNNTHDYNNSDNKIKNTFNDFDATIKLSFYFNNYNKSDDNNESDDKIKFSRNLQLQEQDQQQQQQQSFKKGKNNIFFDIKGRINHSILYRCQFNYTFAINSFKSEKDNYYIPYTTNDMLEINNNKEFTVYSFQRDLNIVIDPLGLLKWSRPGKCIFFLSN